MKWALIIVGGLVGIILLVTFVGALLPRDHVATVTAVVPAPQDTVWATLTEITAYPTWRTEVERVEPLSQPAAPLSWREHGKQGTLTLAVEEFEPPRRLVARIADKNLPYGGAWEYVLTPDTDPAKTRVSITERGYVSNYLFRFVSRFVMGHHATLDGYLRALGRKFGAEVTPVHAS